jgi:biotin transport system substrate-specific component
MKRKINSREIAAAAVLTAITAVLAQISIPMPTGVPLTLQTFAIALCGFVLGKRLGTLSVSAYILLGLAGAPVFSGFMGGAGKLFGVTGGFIFGFLPMAFLCGLGAERKHPAYKFLLCFAGILCCHALGVLWFSLSVSVSVLKAFLTVSAPYLIKDAASIAAAYFLSVPLRKALSSTTLRIER